MAIPLEDADIKKPGCNRGTRDQPGPVENGNGDGAPCLTPLLVHQGNNSAMHSVVLRFRWSGVLTTAGKLLHIPVVV
jgi:hypothetical protein